MPFNKIWSSKYSGNVFYLVWVWFFEYIACVMLPNLDINQYCYQIRAARATLSPLLMRWKTKMWDRSLLWYKFTFVYTRQSMRCQDETASPSSKYKSLWCCVYNAKNPHFPVLWDNKNPIYDIGQLAWKITLYELVLQ